MIIDEDLPRITKANLHRVGIEIDDQLAAHWMERGFLLLAAYLTRHAMLDALEKEDEA